MSTPLQNKLLSYTVQPPERVWDSIAASLNNRETALATKLQQFEVTPPEKVWNNIEKQLPAATPVRSIKSKNIRAYAAAAAVLIAVIFTVIYTKESNTAPQRATYVQQPQNQNPVSQTAGAAPYPSSPAPAATAENSRNTNYTRKSFEDDRGFVAHTLPVQQLAAADADMSFIPTVATPVQTVPAPTEKYMVYSDEDGNAMRLSKKIFDFFSCASKRPDCRHQLQQLQQQFATTSTTDFAGVVELLRKLNEENR